MCIRDSINAEYMGKGFISINVERSLYEEKPHILFQVVDSGFGMTDQEVLSLRTVITECGNSEVEATLAQETKGVYFGVTASQTLLICMGSPTGLMVESQVSQGSKFSFMLPLDLYVPDEIIENPKAEKLIRSRSWGPSLRPSPRSLTQQVLPPISHKRLPSTTDLECMCRLALIVDDNEYNLAVLETKLRRFNLPAVKATNGVEAIQKVEALVSKGPKCRSFSCTRISIVIMDVDMPMMNGLEATENLVRKMKKLEIPKIPIIGCSAFDSAEDFSRASAAGMSDYLTKPVLDDNIRRVLIKYGLMTGS
eukprot:TRINITY_DN11406_c0_g1_i1.p1 TRINITY_DN11406_c0_g1~~TRINITY_DN11406_c0_g1_i1.p1  ORF type:complete len:309 (+),score=48.98 TRINITY_DN11406_c0_g1_i1:62-988(+)